jgi:hypothetical protein
MWPTMLSFHWSIRRQQLMTSVSTCLRMVARAILWQSVGLLQRAHWKDPPSVASCILERDSNAYNLCQHVAYWKGPPLAWSVWSGFDQFTYLRDKVISPVTAVCDHWMYANIARFVNLFFHNAEFHEWGSTAKYQAQLIELLCDCNCNIRTLFNWITFIDKLFSALCEHCVIKLAEQYYYSSWESTVTYITRATMPRSNETSARQ